MIRHIIIVTNCIHLYLIIFNPRNQFESLMHMYETQKILLIFCMVKLFKTELTKF